MQCMLWSAQAQSQHLGGTTNRRDTPFAELTRFGHSGCCVLACAGWALVFTSRSLPVSARPPKRGL